MLYYGRKQKDSLAKETGHQNRLHPTKVGADGYELYFVRRGEVFKVVVVTVRIAITVLTD